MRQEFACTPVSTAYSPGAQSLSMTPGSAGDLYIRHCAIFFNLYARPLRFASAVRVYASANAW